MIAYKCLRIENEKLYSANTSLDFPEYKQFSLEYFPGVETTPLIPSSKLFVFKNKEDAEKFLRGMWCNSQLWKVEAKNAKKVKYLSGELGDIGNFWKRKLSHKKVYTNKTMYAPHGTYGCDSIKLIERIQ